MTRAIVIAAALLCGTANARADGFEPPSLEGYVVDAANVLPYQTINSGLKRFHRDHGFVIVVFTAANLAGSSIEDAAYKTFNAWKVGDAGKDNGVLLMIATLDRKVKIETGKGVGHIVTDIQSNDIITKMRPLLAKGEFDGAIGVGVKELEQLFLKADEPLPKRVPIYKKWWFILLVSFGGLSGLIALITTLSARAKAKLGITGAVARGVWAVLPLVTKLASRKRNDRDGGHGGTSGGGGATTTY